MIILYGICFGLLLLYLSYPVWLKIFSRDTGRIPGKVRECPGISLVYLSCNGIKYLEEKISFLRGELKGFSEHEMIIIDGKSTDGSKAFLESLPPEDNIRLIIEDKPQGVAHAMNLGVKEAKYEYIVFCDQRQALSANILKKIVAPLADDEVGAVSACISHTDKSCYCSWMRKFENRIKEIESRSGNLVGVYGPLYAVKKSSYTPLPDNTILDDLYLSLKIMGSKKVLLHPSCLITDEGMAGIYNYQRAKRYLRGFLQILRDKEIWQQLNRRQVTMVVWHKYLRLLIPLIFFVCIALTGLYGIVEPAYLFPFGMFLLLVGLSFIPAVGRHFQPASILRINALYFIASADILLHALFYGKKTT